ncbi:MAG: hypothetical protein AVDCRST_MAG49-1041 [uncultured Thermomicrobiales bacterium]|uniref:Uncharacterized protein n=1 Tax=uncultured Thermomicrobiales bacterium TaxID=1645740 RepID=A0A6J4UA93_9BACT|nr:MAG: hypothetical protein AVDCRST_MAG49-1041 [uncultured Thermomicrobiales bacterium]
MPLPRNEPRPRRSPCPPGRRPWLRAGTAPFQGDLEASAKLPSMDPKPTPTAATPSHDAPLRTGATTVPPEGDPAAPVDASPGTTASPTHPEPIDSAPAAGGSLVPAEAPRPRSRRARRARGTDAAAGGAEIGATKVGTTEIGATETSTTETRTAAPPVSDAGPLSADPSLASIGGVSIDGTDALTTGVAVPDHPDRAAIGLALGVVVLLLVCAALALVAA